MRKLGCCNVRKSHWRAVMPNQRGSHLGLRRFSCRFSQLTAKKANRSSNGTDSLDWIGLGVLLFPRWWCASRSVFQQRITEFPSLILALAGCVALVGFM